MAAFQHSLLLLAVAAASASVAASVSSASAFSSPRSKRGLLELAGMIKCTTERSPLDYAFYGCYCGLGGSGWPRDRTDWCCHKHDCCYDSAERQGCSTKTDRYDWSCDDRTANCVDLTDTCEKLLCKCDRDAAKCLRNSPFQRKFTLWPNWRCGSRQPMCSIY
ncbi:group 10 secretory phospholipase A2 [Hippocampus comes]|uniref:Phospholipase A2 n=1 Tax=Hippocampus comes TaxID=109280 RepID=A0A3Q3D7M4_HIPCM|nr:PREDICTED: group 10 secretory phospholipase A2-like [Hippocampus comes]